jgi:hypothetical protein
MSVKFLRRETGLSEQVRIGPNHLVIEEAVDCRDPQSVFITCEPLCQSLASNLRVRDAGNTCTTMETFPFCEHGFHMPSQPVCLSRARTDLPEAQLAVLQRNQLVSEEFENGLLLTS